MNVSKIKDGAWLKIIDGKPVLADMPTYSQWCKYEKLPHDYHSRRIYDEWVKYSPTLLKVVQCIFNEEIIEASEMLNKIAEKIKSDTPQLFV